MSREISTGGNRGRKGKKPNKRVVPRAASFKRIAKVLRIRATGYRRSAKLRKREGQFVQCDFDNLTSKILRNIAAEFDNEAATLRAQR